MNRINVNWLTKVELKASEKSAFLLSVLESLMEIKRADKLALIYSLVTSPNHNSFLNCA